MFERFTKGAREAVERAQDEARAIGSEKIDTGEMLLGVAGGSGAGARVLAEHGASYEALRDRVASGALDGEALAAIGIDLERVNARLTETFGAAATAPAPTPYDAEARDALAAALDGASGRDVGTEHVLAGVLGRSDGRAVKLLEHLGVDVAALAARVRTWG